MIHNCKLVADVAVFQDNKVLLVRYRSINKYDHQQGWFLPDDYLQSFEHPEFAAKRILKEQIGIEFDALGLSHIESFKGNDGSWHMVFHFKLNVAEKKALKLLQDVAEAKWFEIAKLPRRSEIAHHGWAMATLSRMIFD